MFDLNINIDINVTTVSKIEAGAYRGFGGPIIYSNQDIPVSERISASTPGPGNRLEPSYGTLAYGAATRPRAWAPDRW